MGHADLLQLAALSWNQAKMISCSTNAPSTYFRLATYTRVSGWVRLMGVLIPTTSTAENREFHLAQCLPATFYHIAICEPSWQYRSSLPWKTASCQGREVLSNLSRNGCTIILSLCENISFERSGRRLLLAFTNLETFSDFDWDRPSREWTKRQTKI